MAMPGRMGALADMLGGMAPPAGMPEDPGMMAPEAGLPQAAPGGGLEDILSQLEGAIVSLPENQKMAAEEAASILRTALQSESPESPQGDLPPEGDVDIDALGGVPVLG